MRWVRKKTDFTLMSITLSQPVSGNASKGAPQEAPALLKRMSTFGVRASTAAANRLISAIWLRSAGTGVAALPSARARLSTSDALRLVRMTCAPFST